MPDILVGTANGLQVLGSGEPQLEGHDVTALVPDGPALWALGYGRVLLRRGEEGWEELAAIDGDDATCVLPVPGGALVGTAGAHLLRLEDSQLGPVKGFEDAEGRHEWYTPWGGPPDTRSLSLGPSGEMYANVHVGGIVRSLDGGHTWGPTIDIHTDVHQVLAGADGERVLAATARGLARSPDRGESWDLEDDGLHSPYCRALAVAGDTLLLSASSGPDGRRCALYRRPLDGSRPLTRCRSGLPEWFSGNIDTGWLAATPGLAAFATAEGTVYASTDQGQSWEEAARGLRPLRCLAVAG